jgi:hypothetical protein
MLNDKIAFELFGLHLLEPMALITNWLMAFFSVYAYFKLSNTATEELKFWKKFYFWFAISTFFGGLGHVFFNYFDIPGKFPNWISAIIAGYFAGKAIIENEINLKRKKNFELFLIIKGGILLSLSFVTFKFVFVAVDAIITYVVFCGFVANSYVKRGLVDLKYMTYGVLVCIPSIFIFFFKLNPHRWLNKDDLSHLLMLACIYFFYLGASKRMNHTEVSLKVDNVIA